ncbi:MAG TPA: VWA domain-containing protein [Vicinamibacterales bacterium]|nr:VWA domain-containing protein [Vicinamibacterales bacterium]
MIHILTALPLLFTLALPEPPQDGAGGSTGRALEIHAVAVDRAGTPIDDLVPDDLEVWIDGRRIPIDSLTLVAPVAGERPGRAITLLIDDVTLTPVGINRAREIARRFVGRMSAGDQMSVVALSGDATTSTDDPTVLARRLDAIRMPSAPFARPDDLSAHVLSTLASIARQAGESRAPRRAIVAIGAPWLFDAPLPPPSATRDVRAEWTDAVRAMAAGGMTLYVIDPGGVGMAPTIGGRDGFARETGGHAFVNTNDVNGAVDRILRELVTYYVIGVTEPPAFGAADVRELDVRSRRRDVTVRARQLLPARR